MITVVERSLIRKLIADADQDVVPLATVQKLASERAADDNAFWEGGQTAVLACGYRVNYTHEEQRQCVCRHISISVWKRGVQAHVDSAREILTAFGFINELEQLPRWLSHQGRVLEFLEPLDGDLNRIKRQN
jgi:hypothetical protein